MDSVLKGQYELVKPKYDALARVVAEVLQKRINEQAIKTLPVIWRSKTIESLMEKIKRKPYKEPINEISDLAGVRVVSFYAPDLDKVEKTIADEFNIIERIDKADTLGFDKMGYLGKHFIIRLSEKYSGPHYEGLHELRCEIQVRTILQDAWAVINHHLIYKNEGSMPEEIRRDMNNVSSLLEIAQNIFDNIFLVKRQAYIRDVESAKARKIDFLQQPVNFETLKIYTEWKYPKQVVSERWHPILLRDLDFSTYKTLADIDRAIEKAKPAVTAYANEQPQLFRNGTAFITKSLGFVDSEFRKKHPFGETTRKAFDTLSYRTLIPETI